MQRYTMIITETVTHEVTVEAHDETHAKILGRMSRNTEETAVAYRIDDIKFIGADPNAELGSWSGEEG